MDQIDLLQKIAYKAMLERGLSPEFPLSVQQQLASINYPESYQEGQMRDLRNLAWCSIDNDDSRDLDQLTFAEKMLEGKYRIYVAIADVDAIVKKNSAIDLHAQQNTTSVYTPACIYPMLPEKLSTNLTSLNYRTERSSIVFEMILSPSMQLESSTIYKAAVYNYAQLAYPSVGNWLEGNGAMPEKVSIIPGLAETIKLQDEIAQAMKRQRQAYGALTFETIELKPHFEKGKIDSLETLTRNRAHELIENLMIAANTASARFSLENQIASLRRVVRVPARWDRIVYLAKGFGFSLPDEPDAKALDRFLNMMKVKSPETFPDLSLSIIKLLGSGEYVAELPGDPPIGHFGLALRDYTHSTAPNRRYPDILTQRMIKAVLNREKSPYSIAELTSLAAQCTQQEDAAAKVERQVKKSAAAMLLSSRIGEHFQAIVTGASDKGTWVRLQEPPIEGKLVSGGNTVDVGDRLQVKLTYVDIERGFIDFVKL